MNPKTEEKFAQLRQAIIDQSFDDSDVFHMIGMFARNQPIIGSALALHMVDFIFENQSREFTYSEAVVELYRRTFFDPVLARKYGTEFIADQGDEKLVEVIDYLVGSLQMDALMTHPTPQPDMFVTAH